MVELNREFLVKKYGNEKLFELREINLYNHKITKIDPKTFKGLTKLEKLSFWINQIEEIDSRLFENLSNLKELYLHGNKLREIDPKCFEPLKKIEVIELYENNGLKALSLIKPFTKYLFDKEEVDKHGSLSDWNTFLQQFPQSGNILNLLL